MKRYKIKSTALPTDKFWYSKLVWYEDEKQIAEDYAKTMCEQNIGLQFSEVVEVDEEGNPINTSVTTNEKTSTRNFEKLLKFSTLYGGTYNNNFKP